VALRVEKARTITELFIWSGMILGLLFTMRNVQQFTAHTIDASPGWLGWWAAWLLDPPLTAQPLPRLMRHHRSTPQGSWLPRLSAWLARHPRGRCRGDQDILDHRKAGLVSSGDRDTGIDQ
jgi:hypothetical protein